MPEKQSRANDPRRLRKLARVWLNVLEVGLVILDLNPIISEPVRFGVLFAVQALWHNIWLSGLAFGLITLLLDTLGALATADLLTRNVTASIINKTNEVVKRLGLSHLADKETSMTVDVLVTLIIGTPLTLILKQRQNPKRTRRENIVLGLELSVIASFAAGLQGTAMVAGIWHQNALTILLAALAIGSFLVIQRWLRRRFS